MAGPSVSIVAGSSPEALLFTIDTTVILEDGLISLNTTTSKSSADMDTADFGVMVAEMDTEHPQIGVSQDGTNVALALPRRHGNSTEGSTNDQPGMLKSLSAYQDAIDAQQRATVERRELQRHKRRGQTQAFLPSALTDPVIPASLDAGKLVKPPITEAPTQEKVPNLLVPTVVPGQEGVLPRFDELYDAVPNTNLGDALRAIGIPITQRYVNSTVGQVQKAIGDIVNTIEEFATAYLTEENLDRLELEPIVSGIERATVALSPLYQVNDTDPIWTFAKSITENVWQASELVDRQEAQRLVDDEVQNRLTDAIACAIIGNSNSEKCPVDTAFPVFGEPSATTPTPGGVLNSFGFFQYIEVSGFVPLCQPVNFGGGVGCIVGRSLEPEQFDGLYTFDVLDEAGFPIYAKGLAFTGEIVDFPADQSANSLLLSRTPGEVGSNAFLPEFGTFGTITVNVDDFSQIGLGQRPPFASTTAREGESIAPITCDAVDPFGGDGFPLCLSGGTWILGRAGSGTCTGLLVQGGASCIFGLPSPQTEEVSITPVDCPEGLPSPYPRP
ncbi:unnamed protein product [Vitrella brassicaformis CCMP3155]|uniref:Uncharacterized protein n=1 Tax=Vitrella brassicaformis (strain CCMP3155) TaxID=1169540 RepID=A0A0G4G084_VITBC|nr:unnamed protein product [Vitrella brassicaformis CCMP3155]|eukprot:CEM21097.1 unnamed protein product [Vitrella brassicaformis CCMP3155]